MRIAVKSDSGITEFFIHIETVDDGQGSTPPTTRTGSSPVPAAKKRPDNRSTTTSADGAVDRAAHGPGRRLLASIVGSTLVTIHTSPDTAARHFGAFLDYGQVAATND